MSAMQRAARRACPWGGLAVLAVAFWSHVLFTDRVLLPGEFLTGFHPFTSLAQTADPPWNILQWDALAQYYPWRLLAHRWLGRGVIPLWNPHEFGGAPFLANGQSAVLYPLNLLFWLMDPARAFGWSAALHFFLAGCFTFLLACRYRLSPFSAFLSAVTFAFCSWLVAWTLLPTLMNVAVWLPLALLLTERLLERPSLPRATALGGVLGVVLLAGHFQIAFYVFFAVVLRVIVFLVEHQLRSREITIAPSPFHLLLAVTIALLLAAAQLLPTAELGRASHRGGPPTPKGYQETRQRSALRVTQLVNLFNPAPYYVDDRVNPYAEHCGYAGLVPLCLAVVGSIAARRRSAFFTLLALLALLYAMGVMTYPFYFLIPGVSQMGGFGRILVLWCFGVAMLAGFGLEWSMGWIRQRSSIHPIIGVLLILATAVDLFSFGRDFNPISPRSLAYPRTQLTDFLQREARIPRILCVTPQWDLFRPSGILPPNAPTVYALHDVQGYDSLQLRRYKEVMDRIEGGPGKSSPALNGNMILLRNFRSPVLDTLAVKYVLALEPLSDRRLRLLGRWDEVFVHENQAAQPRSFWQASSTHTAPQRRAAPLTEASPQVVSVRADAPARGVVVLADSSFSGWRASVNGAAHPMESSAIQRRVAVGRGRQEVQFVYFPTTFSVGLFLSGIAVSLIAAAFVNSRRDVWAYGRMGE